MSLYWYACISTNTYYFGMYYILLEMNWWALYDASSIIWIYSAIHEILANEAFTATDGLISQLFIVAFVHPTYMRIALIWGFPAQLSSCGDTSWIKFVTRSTCIINLYCMRNICGLNCGLHTCYNLGPKI